MKESVRLYVTFTFPFFAMMGLLVLLASSAAWQ